MKFTTLFAYGRIVRILRTASVVHAQFGCLGRSGASSPADGRRCGKVAARCLLATLFTVVAGCSAGDSASIYEIHGSTMGTQFSVQVRANGPLADQEVLRRDIDNLLRQVERSFSTYMVGSEISQFNLSTSLDWQPASLDFCLRAEEGIAISHLTDGVFDITVGPLVNLWGFGPDGASPKPPSDAEIADAQQRVGFKRLHTDCAKPAVRKDVAGVYLDMSAFVPGYAVDRIAELLDSAKVENYLVDIGGELMARGRNAEGKPWAIAIEEPLDQDRDVHSIIHLTDRAVATSGDYRNFFEFDGKRYAHMIDPRSGRPVTHSLASVTVVADTAAFADAMATALMVLGPEDGHKLATSQNLAALFLVRTTTGFAELSTPAFIEAQATSRP